MSAPQITRRALLASGAAVLAANVLPAPAAGAHGRGRYAWRNVEIVGGGFVPGIIVNQGEPGLVYARTDIGGAYRFSQREQRWIPLLDWVGWDQWGFTGVVSLATDAVSPNRVYAAVGTYTNDWDPSQGAILRSANRGRTWQVSVLPFKQGGNMPGRGMGERLAIDPNRNSILYLGARTASTPPPTSPIRARGLEETAVLDLISPPTGAHLLSAVGDVGGFVHHDFANPGLMHANPTFGSTTSLDYAGLSPNVIVRSGNPSGGSIHFGISTDGGDTWTPAATEPSGIGAGGTVAVDADGSRVVWSPAGAGVHWSADAGATWTPSAGVPAGATVESDRVSASKFYAYAGGVFYISSDGGATFEASTVSGLPAEGNVRFKAVPGHAGHVWLAGGAEGGTYGLWRSTDAGASFTRRSNVEKADAIGFGQAAPGEAYPAIYITAQVRGVRGFFRSDDAGRGWERINDDEH